MSRYWICFSLISIRSAALQSQPTVDFYLTKAPQRENFSKYQECSCHLCSHKRSQLQIRHQQLHFKIFQAHGCEINRCHPAVLHRKGSDWFGENMWEPNWPPCSHLSQHGHVPTFQLEPRMAAFTSPGLLVLFMTPLQQTSKVGLP